MTIKIPVLSFSVSIFICFLSLLIFYQGWLIYFKEKERPIFIYALILRIVSIFGQEKKYSKWMSLSLTPSTIKTQGLSALIGGFLGFCGGILMFLSALARIVIN